MIVAGPLPGVVRLLADVPDPVFAEAMVGPGAAVEPGDVAEVWAVAPCDGVVSAMHAHAFVVTPTLPGPSVLVHLGLDTLHLAGQGFELRVAVGDRVTCGRPLVRWSPRAVAQAGFATVCPVVLLAADPSADPGAVDLLVPLGSPVAAGAPLLSWRPGT